MTVILVVVLLVVVAGAAVLLFARGGDKPRYERLGAPPEAHPDPLIRTDSRRGDSPAGTDLDKPGGREHGGE